MALQPAPSREGATENTEIIMGLVESIGVLGH
jgi:hypothetical protein